MNTLRGSKPLKLTTQLLVWLNPNWLTVIYSLQSEYCTIQPTQKFCFLYKIVKTSSPEEKWQFPLWRVFSSVVIIRALPIILQFNVLIWLDLIFLHFRSSVFRANSSWCLVSPAKALDVCGTLARCSSAIRAETWSFVIAADAGPGCRLVNKDGKF